MARGVPKSAARVVTALLLANAVSVFLFLARAVDTRTSRYWFLIWNLFLGWLPLLFAWWLHNRLKTNRWLGPGNIALTTVWLSFLPNSFYIISDLIHLRNTGEVSILYDVVMLFSFILNGFIMGFISLFIIHSELAKRIKQVQAHLLIGTVLLLCSFAIYLGRYLRWNTWDVLINPAGLLFDVSDRIINPIAHPQSFVTTTTFFLLLGSTYLVIWELANALRRSR